MNGEVQSQIRIFIDDLFGNKPEEKRIQWSQLFIDQELDTLDDIKELSDESWKSLTINLPLKIRQTIEKKLRIKQQRPQKNTGSSCDTKNIDVNKITHISENDITKIIQLMNNQVSPEVIVVMLDATLGTPRGDAIFQRIKLLTRPPKPQPTNLKLISPQTKDMLPLFHYQEKEDVLRKYYTFVVIGQTGSGKTTLLDAFVNMLTGMEYIDNWRWQLVDERAIAEKNKNVIGASKTASITTYYINDCLNKFNMRIIDTPGFGDTSGIKVDDQITEKFSELFTQLPEIDYIILTIKASQTRLKPGSKYVYERVQQLFGANAKDRFIMMCTFADDSNPKCLEAISQDIICQKYFKFNNSAIYAPSYKEGSSTKIFWKMAMNSVRQFTQYVISKDRLPLSLKLSSEVLETRKYITTSINTSQICLKQTWKQLENAKISLKNFSENQDKIKKMGKYTEKISRSKMVRRPLSNTVQMCLACQVTCCQYCVWPPGSLQSACSYFSGGRNCPVCPGKCPKSSHDRAAFVIVTQYWEEQVIVDFKKKMFDQSLSQAQVYRKVLEQKILQIDDLANTIWNLSNQIKNNLKKLESIALKPKLFTDKDFYLQMIRQQEDMREDGWGERVEALHDVLKKIQNLNEIQKILSIDELFPDLQQLKTSFKTLEQRKKNQNCQIY